MREQIKSKQRQQTKTPTFNSIFKLVFKLNFLCLDWLKENKISQTFEHLPEEELAEILRKFYGTVLQKTGKESANLAS